MTYNIAQYSTSVDLWTGIGLNLLETELALANNPGAFRSLALYDQARSVYYPDYKRSGGMFPTGWNGDVTLDSNDFSQDAWGTTGISLLSPSKLTTDLLKATWDFANARKQEYPYHLNYNMLNSGGVVTPDQSKDFVPPELQYGIGFSTHYTLLDEVKTGDSSAVSYLLDQSSSTQYLGSIPHALILSNHGGSFYSGSNFDGPDFDNDLLGGSLQVVDLALALQDSIDIESNRDRLGLLAYDECLMANVETITELADSTRYFLASEEVIPGFGFDYFITLSNFKSIGDLSAQHEIEAASRELGLGFVSTYSERNGSNYTLSLTDASAIDPLNAAIKAYADAFTQLNDSALVDLLKALRVKGTHYHTDWLQDLGNLAMVSRSALGVSDALKQASDSILTALQSVVVANNQDYKPGVQDFDFGKSSGLTITLPTQPSKDLTDPGLFISNFVKTAPKFEAATGWSRVLDRVLPLVKKVQANSGVVGAVVDRQSRPIQENVGGDTSYVLQFDGYLYESTSDSLINSDVYDFGVVWDETTGSIALSNIALNLNILTLANTGSAEVSIVSTEGSIKAVWNLDISSSGLYSLYAKDLPDSGFGVVVQPSDRLRITPRHGLSADYDLHLDIQNYALPLATLQPAARLTGPALLNAAFYSGDSYTLQFRTPVLPPLIDNSLAEFYTSLVLLPAYAHSAAFSGIEILDLDSGGRLQLLSDDFIEEYVNLRPDTEYQATISYVNSEVPSSEPVDLAFQFDYFASPRELLADGLLNMDFSIDNWGLIAVDHRLDGSQTISEMVSSRRIRDIQDLQEGSSFDSEGSSYRAIDVDSTSQLESRKDGGTQTYFSGLWSAMEDIEINVFIEGVCANSSQFGFYRVDELTGAIITGDGLVMPGDSPAYLQAAKDNLLSPLVDLKGLNKSASVAVNFTAGGTYAALLVTEDRMGSQTALYSLIGANPGRSVQCLDFGKGYYGFEDLVQGRDLNWDGDYNDVTFYLA